MPARIDRAVRRWLAQGRLAAVAILMAAPTVAAPPPSAPPISSAAEAGRSFDRGDYAGAVAAATARLRASPTDTAAALVLARAQAALGRFDAAYTVLRGLLAREPGDADALYYVAILGGVLAQSEYDRLLAIAPDSARAHQLRGDLEQARDRPA